MLNMYCLKVLQWSLFMMIGSLLILSGASAQPVIIDHHSTDITQIPSSALEQAKTSLHIAYGHTSHGSQLTTGMTGLVDFANNGGLGLNLPDNFFQWNNGGANEALDLHDYFQPGDLGNPDRTTWAQRTRDYLDDVSNADVNVVIWSWCGQVDASQAEIEQYLSLMNQLELDYPQVQFVYMTGHTTGTGETGNVHIRNQQIRSYCIQNNKILYDFYTIETYDPDGNYYGDKGVNDACDYDTDNDGVRDANWATDWQNSHIEDSDWYTCSSAHSQPLNANQKAYAAWWLWAVLAGWNPDIDLCPADPAKLSPGICGCGVPDVDTDMDGTMDCIDNCPNDPDKVEPGVSGCGNPEDNNNDGGGGGSNGGCLLNTLNHLL